MGDITGTSRGAVYGITSGIDFGMSLGFEAILRFPSILYSFVLMAEPLKSFPAVSILTFD